MYIEPCYKQELGFILNNIHLYYKTAHNLKQGKFFGFYVVKYITSL